MSPFLVIMSGLGLLTAIAFCIETARSHVGRASDYLPAIAMIALTAPALSYHFFGIGLRIY
jgi:hypothetical protein